MNEIKNVFISHYHEDEENIKKMKELLGDEYCIRNYSVTSEKYNNATNEEYIKSMLRPLINYAGVFICLIGPKTNESKWVDWEIKYAENKCKLIIGVYIRGATDSDIPPALNDYADAIVGWQKDKIVDAMNGKVSFERSDGCPREYISQRFEC